MAVSQHSQLLDMGVYIGHQRSAIGSSSSTPLVLRQQSPCPPTKAITTKKSKTILTKQKSSIGNEFLSFGISQNKFHNRFYKTDRGLVCFWVFLNSHHCMKTTANRNSDSKRLVWFWIFLNFHHCVKTNNLSKTKQQKIDNCFRITTNFPF